MNQRDKGTMYILLFQLPVAFGQVTEKSKPLEYSKGECPSSSSRAHKLSQIQ